MPDVVKSASNPVAKRIRALAERKHRKREGAFVVEGMQPVWRASESGWDVECLIVSPDLVRNDAVLDLAESLQLRDSNVVYMSADLFERLSDRDGPAGVMAIVKTRDTVLADYDGSPNQFWIVLDRVHNPGNLGTIIRTADAAGCSGVILTGDSTDPFSPVAVKASMGSIFAIPVVQEREFADVRAWAGQRGITLVGTSGYADKPHWDFEWKSPLALVLGNEGDGLPEDLIQQLDTTVRIPMTGTAESLNLGIAAGILMYEVQRDRIR